MQSNCLASISSPTFTATSVTVPSLVAIIAVSIFIASIDIKRSPAFTGSPFWTHSAEIKPGIGAATCRTSFSLAIRTAAMLAAAAFSTTLIVLGWPFSSKKSFRSPLSLISLIAARTMLRTLPLSISTRTCSPIDMP